MVDNVELNSGSGGATLAADDISGIHHQRVKVQHGADGSATDASATDPLPVRGNGVTATGSITGASQSVTINCRGLSVVGIQATNTWVATLGVDGTIDGTNWVDLETFTVDGLQAGTTFTGNGILWVNCQGLDQVRVFSDAYTSGTADIDLVASEGKVWGDHVTYVEDTAHASGDAGIQVLAVRRDAHSTLVDTDGDYAPLQVNSSGHLRVNVSGDGSDLGIVTSSIDANGEIVSIGSLDTHNALGFQIAGTWVGTLEVEGRTDGSNWTSLHAYSQVDGADQGSTLTANGMFMLTGGPLTNARLRATAWTSGQADIRFIGHQKGNSITHGIHREDDAHTSGDTGIQVMGVRNDTPGSLVDTDGDYAPVQVNSSGAVRVAVDESLAGITEYTEDVAAPADPSGLTVLMTRDDALSTVSEAEGDWSRLRGTAEGALWVAVNGTVSVDLGSNNDVQGMAAHDAGVSGNPLLIGAEARTTLPTAVGNGDAVRLQADDQGVLITSNTPRNLISTARVALTTTTETTVLAAIAATFIDLTDIILSNSSGSAVTVDIRDSTAGTIRLTLHLAATGGGASINLRTALPQATANNNWTAQLSAAVSTVYVTLIGLRKL